MASRSAHVLSPAAGAVVVACVLVIANAGASVLGSGDRALVTHCVRAVLGVGRAPATAVPGSADSQLISQLAILRRARSPADALPAVSGLRTTLAQVGASTYDPSAAVRLTQDRAGGTVYAVPAMLPAPSLPAECAGLRQLRGASAFLAFRAAEQGDGPGACLISTQLEPRAPAGSSRPGTPAPKPARTLAITGIACKSEVILSGYSGALGGPLLASGTHLALIPDGVATITYTVPDGRQFTAAVTGNLVHVPAAAVSLTRAQRLRTPAQLGRALAALLPTTVTESGAGASATVTLTRPASYIAGAVGSFAFLRGLVQPGSAGSSSVGFGSVSCNARTHRCLSVSVTTSCDSHEHCRTSRTIHRYRYVGARPPRGTTRVQSLPTAPIVARVNRLVTRPGKLTLVLSGTPERVAVVLSVTCFSQNTQASGGGPVLTLAVPSRRPIALPGRARLFRACDVAALVTSPRRGPVRVTVARG